MEYLYFFILAVVCYFIGNITWARVVAKAKHDDITKHGSGNPGTLNSWRSYGFWPGVITFVLDMLKGLICALAGYWIFKCCGLNAEVALYVGGFACVLGHIYPVLFKFKGGKGIATSIGVFFVANWWVTLICFVLMIVSMLFIKYASICTLLEIIVLSVVELCLVNPANWLNYIMICGILFLVLFAHRTNIKRLFTGKENKTELLAMLKKIGKNKSGEAQKQPVENDVYGAEQPIEDKSLNNIDGQNEK